jgi:imidazolonepropionase-like amidohydrolase
MRAEWALGFAMVWAASGVAQVPNGGAVTHFVNGQWFDGTRFVKGDFYAEGAVLTKHPHERRAYQVVDLHGGYVVPPYGDAHEHNFDDPRGTPDVTAQYLRDGIFYAQGMTDTTLGAKAVVAAGLVNTPATVDVTYAHGSITAPQGHPKEIYESIVNGFYYPATPEQKALVMSSNKREGDAFWQIATPEELEAKWPKILATKPDLIKIILTDSEHYTADWREHPVLGKGLDPALVPLVTGKAHAAGLKVAAHVDTATDVHIAVTGGVDELGHMPGYYLGAKDDPASVRIADADIAVMAKRHIPVQATAGIDTDEKTPVEDLKVRQAAQRDNLRRLKAAGIVVIVGSDHYGQDSVHEADYLQGLGVWSNLEMLRMWSVAAPQDVFPKRKIGELKEGYEASFLVLKANPLERWGAVHEIGDRWKQGERVVVEKK